MPTIHQLIKKAPGGALVSINKVKIWKPASKTRRVLQVKTDDAEEMKPNSALRTIDRVRLRTVKRSYALSPGEEKTSRNTSMCWSRRSRAPIAGCAYNIVRAR